MKVQAYRRGPTEKIAVDFGGQSIKFAANDRGDVVATIEDDELAIALIAAAPCGFRAYGGDTTPAVVKPRPAMKFDGDLDDELDEDKNDSNDGSSTLMPPPEPTQELATEPARFVITSPEGEVYDLGPLDDEQVRKFAQDQGLAKPHHTKKGDNLKLFVIDALKSVG